jgi:hypothetical protein
MKGNRGAPFLLLPPIVLVLVLVLLLVLLLLVLLLLIIIMSSGSSIVIADDVLSCWRRLKQPACLRTNHSISLITEARLVPPRHIQDAPLRQLCSFFSSPMRNAITTR